LLIGVSVGVFVAAVLLSALSGLSYPRVGMIGVVLGLGLWIANAIVIFRGPDNPDLGEGGWTVLVGVLLALYVGVWLLGSAVGRALRTRSTRGTSAAT
jgi:hypothetical protein